MLTSKCKDYFKVFLRTAVFCPIVLCEKKKEQIIIYRLSIVNDVKDTITNYEQNNIVNTNKNSKILDPTIGLDAIIHDNVPVLTSQNLERQEISSSSSSSLKENQSHLDWGAHPYSVDTPGVYLHSQHPLVCRLTGCRPLKCIFQGGGGGGGGGRGVANKRRT